MHQPTISTTISLMAKLLIFCWVQGAMATDTARLQDIVDRTSHYILDVLKDASIDRLEKNNRIIATVDSLIDFDLMAKLSLGKIAWQHMTTEQTNKYTSAFENRVKALYLDTLHLFDGQTVRIDSAKQTSTKRIAVPVYIMDGNKNREILYKFFRNNENLWRVYDIRIEGVSIVQTYRSQFTEFLQGASVTDLIEMLRKDLSE